MIRILLLVLAVAAVAQAQNSKLIFVQHVFRHGSRYPIYPSPLDNSQFAVDEHSVGELTPQGKAMHYMLGQMLFNDYWVKLFGNNNLKYNQSKFYFKSTDVNRTIESAQSQLMGLFQNIEPLTLSDSDLPISLPAWNYTIPRTSGPVFSQAPGLHPLPLHVQKPQMSPWSKGDFLRTYSQTFCYRQNDWIMTNKVNPRVQEIVNHPNFINAVEQLNQALGTTNLTFFDIYKYYDNAECQLHMGRKRLPIFEQDSQVKRDLTAIYTLDTYIKYFLTEEQLSATATGFFNATVNHFKRVTKDKSGVQWAFYSAHDTSVINFLARLGLASAECIFQNYLNGTVKDQDSEFCIVEYPTYTSTLLFEVYQNSDRPHTFKIRYNGKYRRIPICDWAFECSVDNMYSWFDHWRDDNFVKSCGIANEDAETYFSIVMVELGLLVCLAAFVFKRWLDSQPLYEKPFQPKRLGRKKSREFYSPRHSQEDEQDRKERTREEKKLTDEQKHNQSANEMIKESLLSEDERGPGAP